MRMASKEGRSPPVRQQSSPRYFTRLFSRWRSEAISIMGRRTDHGTDEDKPSSSLPSSSFSIADQTPRIVQRINRWSSPKSKTQSSESGPVFLLTDTSSSGQAEPSTCSPPISPPFTTDHLGRIPSNHSTSATLVEEEGEQETMPADAGMSDHARSRFDFDHQTVEQSYLDTSKPSTSHMDSAAGRPSTSGGGPLQGLMEVRLPKFPLMKLRHKQQSFTDQAAWKPGDDRTWTNASGVCVRLRGARLERLAAVERQVLQKLAFTHLQKTNLGCAILRPKDSLPVRQKRHKYIKRKAHTVNVVDKKDAAMSSTGICKRKSPGPHGSGQQVFGVPLSQCIQNEQQWEWAKGTEEPGASGSGPAIPHSVASSSTPSGSGLQSAQHPTTRTVPAHHQQPLPSTSSSSSGIGTSISGAGKQIVNRHLQQLTDEQKHRCQSLDLDEVEFLNVARVSPQRLSAESSKSSLSDQASSDSLIMRPGGYGKGQLSNQTSAENTPSSDRRYASSDSLLGSPSYQYSPRYASSGSRLPKQESCEPHLPRIPKVVQVCTEYLAQRGLQTIGIFRVAGSAKRCRQLRLELDSGQSVVLNEDQPDIYPHDVATLLKEYFRDLPDPLLTKELYGPFIATAKFPEEMRVELLRYLISLLPLANCDTLLVLLQFLRRVAKHSYDTINDQGVSMSGNKMNAHNLATVFGPTILRQAPGKATTWLENDAVIRVMETMVERCDDLFTIPPSLQDTLYRSLSDTDPDALDLILTRLASESGREQEEEIQTAVYFSSQEELDPPSVSKESDGSTVVRTRQTTTHRIVYKIHRPTGRILGSSRAISSSSPSAPSDLSKHAGLEKFPELSLFSGEGRSSYTDDPLDLVDVSSSSTAAVLVGSPSTSRALALGVLSKPPGRKLTPLVKLSEAIRSNSPKK